MALKKGPIDVKAFADDGTVIVSGKDPNSLVDIMQRAINRDALPWAKKAGLEFVPKKTEAMFFHRAKFPYEPKRLKINGYEIQDILARVSLLSSNLSKC